jgi:hypothetical protein|tara:strand:+ start:781 stop:882 length:102 start_codon:yes stop_codon:yes gene_type:complete
MKVTTKKMKKYFMRVISITKILELAFTARLSGF